MKNTYSFSSKRLRGVKNAFSEKTGVELKEQKDGYMPKRLISAAVAAVLIFTAIGVIPMLGGNSGFGITAYAAESEGKGGLKLSPDSSAVLPWGKLTRSESGEYADYSLTQFKISGKNIESVTVTADNGKLLYIGVEGFYVEFNQISLGDASTAQEFKIDSGLNNEIQSGGSITAYPGKKIPPDAKAPIETRVTWLPSNDMVRKIIEHEPMSSITDNLTITVKTKDGKTTVKNILLSFSEDGSTVAKLTD